MTGFLLQGGDDSTQCVQPARLEALLGRRGRLGRRDEVHGAAAVGVMHPWEAESGHGSPIHREGRLLVAADASIYYRDALSRRLGRRSPQDPHASAPAWIAAAYRAAGADCAEWLEGDFAFVLWDGEARRLLAARDPFGLRTLFWARRPHGMAVSSLLDPLRYVMGDPAMDATDLLRAMLIQHGDGSGTPWAGIRELPAGWMLEWEEGREPETRRYWYPKVRPEWSAGSVSEGGALLAGLLRDAALERLAPGRPGTAIGMSGGRDSTAIVGALLGTGGGLVDPEALRILSFRYPDGDPGNEDRYVELIRAHLGLDVTWLDTDAMPLIGGSGVAGAPRTRPEPQPFEGQNRTLAAAGRDAGATVLLNGNGGDNLFGLHDSWLADLLRSGRWLALARILRQKGYRRPRDLVNVVVRPAVPLVLIDAIERLRRRRILSRPWECHAPPWISTGVLERTGIVEQDRAAYAGEIASKTTTLTERSRLWAFLYSGFSRNSASLFDMTLDEGLELRMPFYDRRVADFAWSRPATDLNDRLEHKVILRHAMQGILPAEVIAPRPHRTGTSDGYFRRAAAREFEAFARSATRDSRLADLGLLDAAVLSDTVDSWVAGRRDHELFLFTTVCVESWIRAADNAA